MKLFTIAAVLASANAQIATCGAYGCSKKMDTTGCSSTTGAQDGCGSGILYPLYKSRVRHKRKMVKAKRIL